MTILETFDSLCSKLENTKSRKEKEAILKEACSSDAWREIIQLFRNALDPKIQFYIYLDENDHSSQDKDYIQVVSFLRALIDRKFIGEEAVLKSKEYLKSKYLRRLVNKNLNVGIGAKTFNKVAKEYDIHFNPINENEENDYQELEFRGMTWKELTHHFPGTWFIQGYQKGVSVTLQTNSDGKVWFSSVLGYGVPITNIEHIIYELEGRNLKDYCFTGKLFFENFEKTIQQIKKPSSDGMGNLKFVISEISYEQPTIGFAEPVISYKDRINLVNDFKESEFVKKIHTEKVSFKNQNQIKSLRDIGYEGYLLIDADWEEGMELVYGKYQLTYNPDLPKKRQVWRHKFS